MELILPAYFLVSLDDLWSVLRAFLIVCPPYFVKWLTFYSNDPGDSVRTWIVFRNALLSPVCICLCITICSAQLRVI